MGTERRERSSGNRNTQGHNIKSTQHSLPHEGHPGVGEVSSPGGLSQRLEPLWCHLGFWLPELGSIDQLGNGASLASGSLFAAH